MLNKLIKHVFWMLFFVVVVSIIKCGISILKFIFMLLCVVFQSFFYISFLCHLHEVLKSHDFVPLLFRSNSKSVNWKINFFHPRWQKGMSQMSAIALNSMLQKWMVLICRWLSLRIKYMKKSGADEWKFLWGKFSWKRSCWVLLFVTQIGCEFVKSYRIFFTES